MKHVSRLLFFAVVTFTSCSNASRRVTIIPLNMLNHSDTTVDRGTQVINKADYYLVQNYKDNKITRNYIDSFVRVNMDSSMKDHSNYSIVFYKESKQTNLENIRINPKVIDRYSQNNDRVYRYSWMNGKFVARYKIRKGKVVEPKSDVQVKDVLE